MTVGWPARKVFARRHVLVELAPLVYGWDPRLVEGVAARVVADPEVVPLVGVAGAVEPVHALASVLAREEVIAERIATGLERHDAPVATPESVAGAVAETERRIGGRLAVEQHQAVERNLLLRAWGGAGGGCRWRGEDDDAGGGGGRVRGVRV